MLKKNCPKKNFARFDFQVRDSQITSLPHKNSSRRRDVTVAWNEPLAASFLGENVPKEHLMYVLEIDPPVDKNDDNSGVTLMPACNVSNSYHSIHCFFKRNHGHHQQD